MGNGGILVAKTDKKVNYANDLLVEDLSTGKWLKYTIIKNQKNILTNLMCGSKSKKLVFLLNIYILLFLHCFLQYRPHFPHQNQPLNKYHLH